jgi:hypothetical protein
MILLASCGTHHPGPWLTQAGRAPWPAASGPLLVCDPPGPAEPWANLETMTRTNRPMIIMKHFIKILKIGFRTAPVLRTFDFNCFVMD